MGKAQVKASIQEPAPVNDINKMSFAELIEHQQAIQDRVDELMSEEIDSVVSKVIELIEKSGIDRREVIRRVRHHFQEQEGNPPKITKTGKLRKEKKVRIYRHPDNAELQWARHNRHMPNWLSDLEKSGVDIETLRIDANE